MSAAATNLISSPYNSALKHPQIIYALQTLKDSRSQTATARALENLVEIFKKIEDLPSIDKERIRFIGNYFDADLKFEFSKDCGDILKIQSTLLNIGNLKNALQIESFFYGSFETPLTIFFQLMEQPFIKELITNIPDILQQACYNIDTTHFEIDVSVFIDYFDALLSGSTLDPEFYSLFLSLRGFIFPPKTGETKQIVQIPYDNLPTYEVLIPYLDHKDVPTKRLAQILCFCGIEKILSSYTLFSLKTLDDLLTAFMIKDSSTIDGKDLFIPFLIKMKTALAKAPIKNLRALVFDEEFATFFKTFPTGFWKISAGDAYEVLLKIEPLLKLRIDPSNRHGIATALEAHGSDPGIRAFIEHCSLSLHKKGHHFSHPLTKAMYCKSKEEFLNLSIYPYASFVFEEMDSASDDFASIVAKTSPCKKKKEKKEVIKTPELSIKIKEPPTYKSLVDSLMTSAKPIAVTGGSKASISSPSCKTPPTKPIAATGGSGTISPHGISSAKPLLTIDPSFLALIHKALADAITYVENLAIDPRILKFFQKDAPLDPVHQAPLELLPIIFTPMHSIIDSFNAKSERRRAIVIVEKEGVITKYIIEATKLNDTIIKRKDRKHGILYHWNIKLPKSCLDFFHLEKDAPSSYPTLHAGSTKACFEEALTCINLHDLKIDVDPQGNAIFTKKDGTRYTILCLVQNRGMK